MQPTWHGVQQAKRIAKLTLHRRHNGCAMARRPIDKSGSLDRSVLRRINLLFEHGFRSPERHERLPCRPGGAPSGTGKDKALPGGQVEALDEPFNARSLTTTMSKQLAPLRRFAAERSSTAAAIRPWRWT